MVTTSKPYYNVVIVDPLASQTEVMNSAFNTEKTLPENRPAEEREYPGEEDSPRFYEDESYFFGAQPSFQEYRHDKVVFFFNYIPPGYHEYKYVIRPLVRGNGIHPPGQAKLMYEPEIFGRSASATTRVE